MTPKTGDRPPDWYRCDRCGRAGVRLWRPYQSFHVELFCVGCAEESQGKPCLLSVSAMSDDRTDQIGWLVPCVPCEADRRSAWGYTSVPDDGVRWWNSLPLMFGGAGG